MGKNKKVFSEFFQAKMLSKKPNQNFFGDKMNLPGQREEVKNYPQTVDKMCIKCG